MSNYRDWLINLAILSITLIVSLSLAEFAIRQLGEYDEDDNFVLDEYGTVRPYHLPIEHTEDLVETYYERFDETILRYDPQTGWSPRPNSVSVKGLYRYNSVGIRSAPTEYSLEPEAGVLRIALFGDSMTHGDEVVFEDTWGYYLEQWLNQLGVRAEVINFGVGGYGMDQALLRWQTLGQQYQPDWVILGLQMENVNRNVNLIRSIYRNSTELPFSKPRFILSDTGALQPINLPPIPPNEVIAVMEDFTAWPLAQHEAFYQTGDYEAAWWQQSKFLALLHEVALNKPTDERISYALEDEAAQVTLAIIEAFEQSVMAQEARFLTVYLPRHKHLTTLLSGEPLAFDTLLTSIGEAYPLIRPEAKRLYESPTPVVEVLYIGGHYSPLGNELVAESLVEYFVQTVNVAETQ